MSAPQTGDTVNDIEGSEDAARTLLALIRAAFPHEGVPGTAYERAAGPRQGAPAEATRMRGHQAPGPHTQPAPAAG
ncbi:MAG: hypothetical protein ACTMH5_13150, partial [Brachybacterium sp.]